MIACNADIGFPVNLAVIKNRPLFFNHSFPQTCFEGKWLQNRLRADKNESRSLLAVDIQGHQHGGFCMRRGLEAFVENFDSQDARRPLSEYWLFESI